ncbi:MAG: PDC sensor domain-containing protein [Candidatus Macondimonas sp.]|jgi:hypothetical protein
MIIRLQSASLNQFLLKLSGEVPVHIGEKRETVRLYEEHLEPIRTLMAAIMEPLQKLGNSLQDDDEALIQTMRDLVARYPFVELLYTLDENGIQRSENISVNRTLTVNKVANERGKDRSTRPYYQQAKAQADLVITEPYISMATCDYCISAARPWLRRDGAIGGYAVVDVRFQAVLDFLRARAQQRRRGLIWGLGLGGLAASIGLLSLLLF